ncbi:hypothetical protein AYO22_03880 [Fonsecaea multimorphosa]|nr:hypothetical protein AYO22_03880 [Fonsecaea multimorphosa]
MAEHNALCSVESFVTQTYDYLVVGGGTAGLVVAARLTENPDVTVGVVEAGGNKMDDELVSTPSAYPAMIGHKEYDWCWESVVQEGAGNKPYAMPRGKLLGGSSGINYLIKHQTLDRPKGGQSVDPRFMPLAAEGDFHGKDGPIHTSFSESYMPIEEDFVKAAYEATGGNNTLHDAWSGDHMGFYSSLGVVDREQDVGKRSYSATGYLRPNLRRPNLKVLTEAHASRIILEGNTARGVEFLHHGKTYRVHTTREVILSAGTIQTPQLLELSGIGDPKILGDAGITCLVQNSRVGANFQDHVLSGMVYDLAPGIQSMDSLQEENFAEQQRQIYQRTKGGMYGNPGMLMGFLSYASLVSSDELEATIAEIRRSSHAQTEFEKSQEELIISQLSDPTFANIQVFCIPCQLDVRAGHDQTVFFGKPPRGKNRITFLVCLEHPLSRGSVHVTSSDPFAAPRIDPGYFRNEIDVKILAAGIKVMDKIARQPILKRSLASRVIPPEDTSLDTEEQRIEYLRQHISTQYHLVGTATMGEVVDEKLAVKGVNSLRVVDASVFPTHVSGNILSTVYAVAEKGADLIKLSDPRFSRS